MRRSSVLVLALLLSLPLACQRGEPGESPPEAADTTGLAEAGSTAEPVGHDHQEELPDRSAEIDRDQGSKPQQVMDLAGIGPGDRVADIFAGSGYYTYLLSERVGPEVRLDRPQAVVAGEPAAELDLDATGRQVQLVVHDDDAVRLEVVTASERADRLA